MAQSRGRRDDLEEVTVRCGLVGVGERHHVPVVTFGAGRPPKPGPILVGPDRDPCNGATGGKR